MLTFAAAQEAAFLLAQAVPTFPTPIAIPAPIVIPWGSYVADLAGVFAAGLGGAVVWGLRFLPSRLRSMLLTAQVDQLLIRAVTFGVNSVTGASRDKVLELDVSNKVLREALGYALLHGSEIVRKFMGTPEDVAEKIWSRLNVASEVSKPDFQAVAAKAATNLAVNSPERVKQVDLVK